VLSAPASIPQLLALPDATVATSGKGPFDVVLAFAEDSSALGKLVPKATAALKAGGALWFAYPKTSSGVATDLTRDRGWEAATKAGWTGVSQVAIDDTWSALRFRPDAEVGPSRARAPRAAEPPAELVAAVRKNAKARATWDALPPSHRREYGDWIAEAKREETKAKRIASAVEMLAAGVKDKNAKYR